MPATLEQALAAARNAYGPTVWMLLDPGAQTRAIYREMRRLDLAEATAQRSRGSAAFARRDRVPMPTSTEPAALRCSAFIKTRSGDRCGWQPIVVHDGLPYCGFHDPQRQRARPRLVAASPEEDMMQTAAD
jgi:hypothetical protein